MKSLKESLHAKRMVTEDHIRELEKSGQEGIRYTALMPDIPWLILGMLCDIGWIMHLIAGVIYFFGNGICSFYDFLALLALLAVQVGYAYIIHLNRIHEKEIATRTQKNLGFGLPVFAGLAAGIIGLIQILASDAPVCALYWMTAGGFLNYLTGFPIFASFRKGIFYGVQ